MKLFLLRLVLLTGLLHLPLGFVFAATNQPGFKKIMVIVLENTDYNEALGLPFLSALAKHGALFSNFMAEAHPSQPNYIAMIAGDTLGVMGDAPVSLNAHHLGDLIELAGKSWKVYAEDYPGNCFLGSSSGKYARKHVPFLSFKDVQTNPERCAKIVEASALDDDLQGGGLPDFSFYVPNLNNDGHNTGAAAADRWLTQAFGAKVRDPAFMKDLLLVVTFDENETRGSPNQIYTVLYGDSVTPGTVVSSPTTHYDILKTIEAGLGLGTLGRNDAQAHVVTGIWR